VKKSRKRRKFELNLKKQTQFAGGEMSVSIYKKGEYEDFHAFGRRKNKANSKPNKLVPSTEFTLSVAEWVQSLP